jgi:hypothetical protein
VIVAQLLCNFAHDTIPALVAGNTLGIVATEAGLELRCPLTPLLLRHLAEAMKAKALVPLPDPGPSFDEIERLVEHDRRELMARVDRLLSEYRDRPVAAARLAS